MIGSLPAAVQDEIGCLLLVEDNEGDAEYIAAMLAEERLDLVHVSTLSAATAALNKRVEDAILLDLRLPDGNGVECVEAIREVAPDVPIIVLTGLDDQMLALRCLSAGAQDYISKNELRSYNLSRVIRYAIARTREIKERSRADQLQELLADIVDSSDDAIVSGDSKGLITSWNPAAERIFGFSAEEALGRPAVELVKAIDIDGALEQRGLMAKALNGEHMGPQEIRRIRRDGKAMILSVMAFGLRNEVGDVRHFGAICRDVTEKQEREEQLRRQYDALVERDRQMRALTARLNRIREEEQQRISREVHDELGQLLTGLKMDLRWVERHAPGDGPSGNEQLIRRLSEAGELLDSTIETVQRIAAELRPSALDALGLSSAVADEARRFEQRTGIRIDCDIADDPTPPDEVATQLFRIFQEMMTNVARHAEANCAKVEFGATQTHWRLCVCDDGKGFADIVSSMSSLGVLGMRERADLLGGSISIENVMGGGARVIALVPR